MRHAAVIDPLVIEDGLSFAHTITKYQEQKHKVAVIVARGATVQLGLADTARCAADLSVASKTLKGLAERMRMPALAKQGEALQAHCQALVSRRAQW